MMTDPNREPSVENLPDDASEGSEQFDETHNEKVADATLDDASPDARNGAVGGTDGITKNQDDTAQ